MMMMMMMKTDISDLFGILAIVDSKVFFDIGLASLGPVMLRRLTPIMADGMILGGVGVNDCARRAEALVLIAEDISNKTIQIIGCRRFPVGVIKVDTV